MIRFNEILETFLSCPRLSSDPNISPDHSIGRSDGRCVQRAGTQSTRVDDSRLLGIPRWRLIIAIIYPQHDEFSKDYPDLPAKGVKLVEFVSVARVRPRTSKGITAGNPTVSLFTVLGSSPVRRYPNLPLSKHPSLGGLDYILRYTHHFNNQNVYPTTI